MPRLPMHAFHKVVLLRFHQHQVHQQQQHFHQEGRDGTDWRSARQQLAPRFHQHEHKQAPAPSQLVECSGDLHNSGALGIWCSGVLHSTDILLLWTRAPGHYQSPQNSGDSHNSSALGLWWSGNLRLFCHSGYWVPEYKSPLWSGDPYNSEHSGAKGL